jgi:hypothetical protein
MAYARQSARRLLLRCRVHAECSLCPAMPAASIWHDATSWPVAALVLEQDTIPKPDGLGRLTRAPDGELSSNNIAWRSKVVEVRFIVFELR